MAEERHDDAGVGPYVRQGAKLTPLNHLDGWDIVEGADVRGWKVATVGGRELGRVRDLLVDEEQHEVVMLDIDLAGEKRDACVPIRAAEFDRETHSVRVDSADIEYRDETEDSRRERLAADREREREVVRDREADREHERLADRADETIRRENGDEVVVRRRPVVVEEVVVRRRTVDGDAPERLADSADRVRERTDEEILKDRPGETY